jgi:hypothetical protein
VPFHSAKNDMKHVLSLQQQPTTQTPSRTLYPNYGTPSIPNSWLASKACYDLASCGRQLHMIGVLLEQRYQRNGKGRSSYKPAEIPCCCSVSACDLQDEPSPYWSGILQQELSCMQLEHLERRHAVQTSLLSTVSNHRWQTRLEQHLFTPGQS